MLDWGDACVERSRVIAQPREERSMAGRGTCHHVVMPSRGASGGAARVHRYELFAGGRSIGWLEVSHTRASWLW